MNADRGEALARLWTELSHELGTALTVLTSTQHVIAARAAARLPASDPLREANEIAADGIDRIARVLAQVRASPAMSLPRRATLADALNATVSRHDADTKNPVTVTVDPALPSCVAAAPAVAAFVASTLLDLHRAGASALCVDAGTHEGRCIVAVSGDPHASGGPPALVFPTRVATSLGGSARRLPPPRRGCEIVFPAGEGPCSMPAEAGRDMGDIRFERAWQEYEEADRLGRRASFLARASNTTLVALLASRRGGSAPYLRNLVATELDNRLAETGFPRSVIEAAWDARAAGREAAERSRAVVAESAAIANATRRLLAQTTTGRVQARSRRAKPARGRVGAR